MTIEATTTASQIKATVTGNSIQAGIVGVSVTTAAAGGVGPQGDQGPPGESTLFGLTDVQIESPLASGDVLRFTGGYWRNYGERNLTDGGNF